MELMISVPVETMVWLLWLALLWLALVGCALTWLLGVRVAHAPDAAWPIMAKASFWVAVVATVALTLISGGG